MRVTERPAPRRPHPPELSSSRFLHSCRDLHTYIYVYTKRERERKRKNAPVPDTMFASEVEKVPSIDRLKNLRDGACDKMYTYRYRNQEKYTASPTCWQNIRRLRVDG